MLYQEIELIGNGQYGTVIKVQNLSDGQYYACKKMSKHQVISAGDQEDLMNEINNLKQSNHPNIIRFNDFKTTDNNFYLVLEYCNGGTLLQAQQNLGLFSEAIARFIILQVIDAIKYLHSLNIVHRDIKADNILLHFPSINEESLRQSGKSEFEIEDLKFNLLKQLNFCVKIGDFGFSKQLRDRHQVMHRFYGTPLNMAPEVMLRKSYNYKVDIWGIGVLLYSILTGSYPFYANNSQDLLMKVETGIFKIKHDIHLTPLCLDFINRCLRYDPSRRIDWDQVVEHPFYSDLMYIKTLQMMSISLDVDENLCQFRKDEFCDILGNDEEQKQEQQPAQNLQEQHLFEQSIQEYLNDILINCRNSYMFELKPNGYFNAEERAEEKGNKLQRILKRDQPYGLSSSLDFDSSVERSMILEFQKLYHRQKESRQFRQGDLQDIIGESLRCDVLSDDLEEGFLVNDSKHQSPLSNFEILKKKGQRKSVNNILELSNKDHDFSIDDDVQSVVHRNKVSAIDLHAKFKIVGEEQHYQTVQFDDEFQKPDLFKKFNNQQNLQKESQMSGFQMARTKNSTNLVALPSGFGTFTRNATFINSKSGINLPQSQLLFNQHANNKDTQELKNLNDSCALQQPKQFIKSSFNALKPEFLDFKELNADEQNSMSLVNRQVEQLKNELSKPALLQVVKNENIPTGMHLNIYQRDNLQHSSGVATDQQLGSSLNLSNQHIYSIPVQKFKQQDDLHPISEEHDEEAKESQRKQISISSPFFKSINERN
eukprot:403357007